MSVTGRISLMLLLAIPILLGAGCAAVPDLEGSRDAAGGDRAAPLPEPTKPQDDVPRPPADRETKDSGGGPEDGAGLKAFYGAGDLTDEEEGDRVLAVVDGREIKTSDLYPIYFMDNPMKMRDILENLVLYVLVQREAARLGIQAEASEVENALAQLLREQQGMIKVKIDDRLSLEEFVRRHYGMEMEAYRGKMRRMAVFQVLLEYCVRYTELQVRRLRIGVIMVKDLAKAGEIHKKLEKGANFEVLARENSIDPSRAIGGLLPPLPADMDYAVVKDALKLGVGEISEVEETVLGDQTVYRIVKLAEIIEPVRGTYAELAARVRSSLEEQPMLFPDVIRYWRDSLEGRYVLEYRIP